MTTDDNELVTAIIDGRERYKLGEEMIEVSNKHVPELHENRLLPADSLYRFEFKCMVEGCHYRAPRPKPEWHDAYVRSFVHDHTMQHDSERAPNIAVEYELVATCSVCADGGDVKMVDSESITCEDCKTSWSIDGTGGYRDERESEEDGA